jgi:LacI family transcriptional regulator
VSDITTDGPSAPRKATRRDVARLAGVSDAVVTYTLNGRAPVAPATARRVLDAIAALDYKPNRTAVALKSGSTRALALIGPSPENRVFMNPFFSEFANVLEDAAHRRGYALYTATASPGAGGVLNRFEDFASRQVDGILLLSSDVAVDPADLNRQGIPWLELNSTEPKTGVDSVGPDLFGGATQAVEHLAEHGHRRIGLVGSAIVGEPRREGWLATCARLDLVADRHFDVPLTQEGGYLAGKELARLDDPPTAVFVVSDLTAVGLLRALHEEGVRMPEDLAIVSFDGSWEGAYSWPALSSVRQPIADMVEESLRRLLDRTDRTDTHSVFPTQLVIRESCGPHRAVGSAVVSQHR